MSQAGASGTRPDGSADTSGLGKNKDINWAELVPKRVEEEDALGAEANKAVWEKIYRAAGKMQAGEKERAGVRFGVYVYGALNGTSREGNYSGNVICFDGTRFSAAIIPQSTGRMNIRKFFRANMMESYDVLKSTKVMESYERFVAKAATLSIGAEAAFAIADWLAECPKFTPVEAKAHETAFTRGIERARRARDGRGLEDVERERVRENMEAQGAKTQGHGPVDF